MEAPIPKSNEAQRPKTPVREGPKITLDSLKEIPIGLIKDKVPESLKQHLKVGKGE